MASAVQPSAENQPAQSSLEQNYPNPFNPTTRIGYSVGRVVAPSGASLSEVEGPVVGGQWLVASSHVRLAVYDMLGREVAVLVDEHKDPGKYTATWNAAGMASGVYVCRLATNDYTQCRTMLLLK
jgi:hypothetical protein